MVLWEYRNKTLIGHAAIGNTLLGLKRMLSLANADAKKEHLICIHHYAHQRSKDVEEMAGLTKNTWHIEQMEVRAEKERS